MFGSISVRDIYATFLDYIIELICGGKLNWNSPLPRNWCCEKGILAIMYLSSKLRGLHTHNTYSLSKQDSMYNSNNLIIKYEVTTVLHKFIYTYNI